MTPDTVFPASHDLQHAMLLFSPCDGCKRLFPAAGLRLDCDRCGARLCSECDKRKRKCACRQIEGFLENCDEFGEGAELMAGATENAPSDRECVNDCVWFRLAK